MKSIIAKKIKEKIDRKQDEIAEQFIANKLEGKTFANKKDEVEFLQKLLTKLLEE